MSRVRPREGYAMLAVLAVIALTGALVAAAAAALSAAQVIQGTDSAGAAAAGAARSGLDAASLRLVADAPAGSGAVAGPAGGRSSYEASWRPAGMAPGGWAQMEVTANGTASRSRRQLSAIVELRAPLWCGGAEVAEDCALAAPLVLAGSGLYCGGSVRGREWVSTLSGTTGSQASDLVHDDVWPLAACHAAGGIWATGVEIHATEACPWPQDTDMHRDAGTVGLFTTGPDPVERELLHDAAVAPGPAYADGVLDIAELPAVSVSAAGLLVEVVQDLDGGAIDLVGSRSPGACPLTVVVIGDCRLGAAGSLCSWHGALFVDGTLEVAGEASLAGHLWTRRLRVAEPLHIEVAPGWRFALPPGVAHAVLVALDES